MTARLFRNERSGHHKKHPLAIRAARSSCGGRCGEAGPDQLARMISGAITACERFYPAFQLVSWADRAPAEAIKVALAETWGRA